MIFYNPFIPQFHKYPIPNFTDNTQKVEKKEDKKEDECKQQNISKINKFIDLIHEPDTLIILVILYFLYTQDTKNDSLMICLLLLLLD